MKEDTQEKSLIKVSENNIFYKIKNFFRCLFYKKDTIKNVSNFEQTVENST